MTNRVVVLFKELKRRKVFRVATVYVGVAWVLSLGAAELFPVFGIPDWVVRLVVIGAFGGFFLAIGLAWAFEVTTEGVVLDPGAAAGDVLSGTTVWVPVSLIEAVWQDQTGEHTASFDHHFVIGRDPDSGLFCNDVKVSRQHARGFFEDDDWWVEDLGSRNGTRVDGIRISQPRRLRNGSEISLYEGAPVLKVRIAVPSNETQLV